MLAADCVLVAAVLFMVCSNLYYGPRIARDRIAMQWGLDGIPTWYAPKRLYLWGVFAFVAFVRLVIWAFATYAPQTVHGEEVGIIGFALVIAATHFFILKTAATSN